MAVYRRGKKGAQPKGKPDYKPQKPLDEQCAEEVGELEKAFRGRMDKEKARFKKATDSEFHICIYFADRAEKEKFLRDFNLARFGDKFLDGRKVAQALHKRGTIKDAHKERR